MVDDLLDAAAMGVKPGIIIISLVLFAIMTLVFWPVAPKDIEKYARKEAWDSYEVGGYCWLGCSDSDWYQTKFKAVKDGKRFEGCVCSGLIGKGATLRLD